MRYRLANHLLNKQIFYAIQNAEIALEALDCLDKRNRENRDINHDIKVNEIEAKKLLEFIEKNELAFDVDKTIYSYPPEFLGRLTGAYTYLKHLVEKVKI